jgi:hypothetical protein
LYVIAVAVTLAAAAHARSRLLLGGFVRWRAGCAATAELLLLGL